VRRTALVVDRGRTHRGRGDADRQRGVRPVPDWRSDRYEPDAGRCRRRNGKRTDEGNGDQQTAHATKPPNELTPSSSHARQEHKHPGLEGRGEAPRHTRRLSAPLRGFVPRRSTGCGRSSTARTMCSAWTLTATATPASDDPGPSERSPHPLSHAKSSLRIRSGR
jgi:hypothetical protein